MVGYGELKKMIHLQKDGFRLIIWKRSSFWKKQLAVQMKNFIISIDPEYNNPLSILQLDL